MGVVRLAAAVVARSLEDGPQARARILAALLFALAAALVAFVIANPYSILDFQSFRRELAHQSSLSAEAQGKLGAPRHGGGVYYPWSLAWGLGCVAALSALAGGL